MLRDCAHALQANCILLSKGQYTCFYAVIVAPWHNLTFSAQRWTSNASGCNIFINRSVVKTQNAHVCLFSHAFFRTEQTPRYLRWYCFYPCLPPTVSPKSYPLKFPESLPSGSADGSLGVDFCDDTELSSSLESAMFPFNLV
jgi:hypothetical protein